MNHQKTIRINTPCGPIDARSDGRIVKASGIPYARAERFSDPEPVGDYREPYEALSPSPACPQLDNDFWEQLHGIDMKEIGTSEDCQNLTVTAPAVFFFRNDVRKTPATEQKPVLIWIHGGSYVAGAGDAPFSDPRPLVEEQGLVVVSVTYRLGMLGFLGGDERPANLGLRDIMVALDWVQRNISAFGGNPGDVTIMGESAGADAIAQLMTLPEARGWFRRAWLQSPPLGADRGRDPMTDAMLKETKKAGDLTEVEEVTDLQKAAEKAGKKYWRTSGMFFGCRYGHTPLPSEAMVDEARDHAAKEGIDLVISTAAEEGRLFVEQDNAPGIDAHAVTFPGGRKLYTMLSTRVMFSAPADRLTSRHAKAGGRAWRVQIDFNRGCHPYGACHAIYYPLIFGNPVGWENAPITSGASSHSLAEAGAAYRGLIGAFAKGESLPIRQSVSGVATLWRVGKPRR